MKSIKRLLKLIAAAILVMAITNVDAQVFESRVVENDMGYLVFQMRETSGTGTPTTSTVINDITFVVRYPTGAVDMDLICATNPYNIVDGLSGEQISGDAVYDYHYWNATNTPFSPPNNWTVNVWEDIAVFKAFGATGSSLFEVAVDNWEGRSHNWNQGSPTGVDYTPTPNGTVTYSYPTLVYDLVWTGASANPTYWDIAGNWETECGGTGTVPNTGNNCIIPVVTSGNYPTKVNLVVGIGNHQPTCDYLRINTGASMSLDDLSESSNQVTYTVNNDLAVYGTLTIIPNSQLSVDGDTYIDAADGIIVQADATGVGSFLDDKAGSGTTTISYGTNGTAKVQTYITNGAIAGSFYIHTVGPTLDEENYTGAGTGAFLQAFDVAPGNTYAYSYDEPSGAWVNQFSYTYPVLTTDGIAMSTDDATAYTMNMSGALITGDIPTPAPLTFGGSNYELISNPWPSAFEFDAFHSSGSNGTVIAGKNWIWDAVGGNYIAYTTGTGGPIQVGQAFFVETLIPGTVTFFNTNRTHSNTPFRNVKTNWLSLAISGGDYGYADQLVIRFEEGATPGYDYEIEAIKWNSMYENSTQIRSIAEDGTELSINVMPELDLQGEMVSVPVHFQCGYEGEYTFTAGDLESFEYGTEIWIEDKLDGYQWHNLSPGHETYTFTASPDDAHDRFIIHFFGPTSVNDFEAQDVKIYGLNEYAYVKNLTKNEIVKEVYIYSLAGTMIMNKQVPEQNIYRFFVSNHDGYYIVRVVTDKNIYTEKVFVH